MMRRPAMLNEPRESGVSRIVLGIVFAIVLIVLVFDLLRAFVFLVVEVKGDSMRDTLYGGEHVGSGYTGGDILYAVRGNDVSRGDIVILDTTASEAYDADGSAVFSAEIIIKRIIAVEGDCVRCENGVLWRKEAGGEYVPLDEPYAKGRTPDFAEVCLGAGEIFFLGDNRANSADSEDIVKEGYPLLATDDVVGVVPDWAVFIKGFSTALERFRAGIYGIFA